MSPYEFLPRRVNVLFPDIKLGNAIAHQTINVRQALEYVRSGLYKQQFVEGEFIGIVYSPQTAKPSKARYIPEDFAHCPIELPGLKFIQPANATPTYLRTVTEFA